MTSIHVVLTATLNIVLHMSTSLNRDTIHRHSINGIFDGQIQIWTEAQLTDTDVNKGKHSQIPHHGTLCGQIQM